MTGLSAFAVTVFLFGLEYPFFWHLVTNTLRNRLSENRVCLHSAISLFLATTIQDNWLKVITVVIDLRNKHTNGVQTAIYFLHVSQMSSNGTHTALSPIAWQFNLLLVSKIQVYGLVITLRLLDFCTQPQWKYRDVAWIYYHKWSHLSPIREGIFKLMPLESESI